MAILKIVTVPDPLLRKKSRELAEITDRTLRLLDDMRDTLHKAQGVGLAGVQVGVLRRIVIVETVPGELYEMINPVITKRSEKMQRCKEGCLSVPDRWGETVRPYAVTVEYTDRNGKRCTLDAEDFLAQAISHELDHLDGVIYTDVAVSMDDEETK
ncbi:MAG: peptide deformylase [Firmicutes bacterium]|nr:peptide deformylase [Candidatus Colimorpha enterica]